MGPSYGDAVPGLTEAPGGDVHEGPAPSSSTDLDTERGDAHEGRPPRATRGFLIAVGVIIVIGAAIRFGYVWFDRRHLEYFGDAYYYHGGANLLADGKGFLSPFAWDDGRTVQGADHPPLYIVYLALWSLFGATTIAWHLFASSVIGVVSIGLAAAVGRRVAGEKVGVVAALLVAVYPNIWRYDGMLVSETIVIAVVLLCILLAYRLWDQPTPWRAVWLGLGVGVATMARSELLLLAPLMILPIILLIRRWSWRQRLGWLVASGVAVGVVLTPWILYNNSRFEERVYLSQNLGGTIVVSYCPTVFEGDLVGYWDYWCGIKAMEAVGAGVLGDPRNEPAMRQAGIDYARDNLDRLPPVVAARLGRIVGVYRPTQQRDLDILLDNATPWVATAGMITLPFVIVGAVAGGVVLRVRRRFQIPLLAPIVAVVVTVAVFYGATRFRATAEAPMCVLMAVALVAAWDALARRFRGDRGERVGPDEPVVDPSVASPPTGSVEPTAPLT